MILSNNKKNTKNSSPKISILKKLLNVLHENNCKDINLINALSKKNNKLLLIDNISLKIKKLLPKLKIKNLNSEDETFLKNTIFQLQLEKLNLSTYNTLEDLIFHKFTSIYDVKVILDNYLTDIIIQPESQTLLNIFVTENILSDSEKLSKRSRVLRPFLRSKTINSEIKGELQALLDLSKKRPLSLREGINLIVG